MKTKRLVVVTLIAALALATGAIAVTVNDGTDAKFLPSKGNSVTADQALKGIPMQITPYQLPSQFSAMRRCCRLARRRTERFFHSVPAPAPVCQGISGTAH